MCSVVCVYISTQARHLAVVPWEKSIDFVVRVKLLLRARFHSDTPSGDVALRRSRDHCAVSLHAPTLDSSLAAAAAAVAVLLKFFATSHERGVGAFEMSERGGST